MSHKSPQKKACVGLPEPEVVPLSENALALLSALCDVSQRARQGPSQDWLSDGRIVCSDDSADAEVLPEPGVAPLPSRLNDPESVLDRLSALYEIWKARQGPSIIAVFPPPLPPSSQKCIVLSAVTGKWAVVFIDGRIECCDDLDDAEALLLQATEPCTFFEIGNEAQGGAMA